MKELGVRFFSLDKEKRLNGTSGEYKKGKLRQPYIFFIDY